MSRMLVGWREIAAMTPFSEETVRKRLKPGMLGHVPFLGLSSESQNDGRIGQPKT